MTRRVTREVAVRTLRGAAALVQAGRQHYLCHAIGRAKGIRLSNGVDTAEARILVDLGMGLSGAAFCMPSLRQERELRVTWALFVADLIESGDIDSEYLK